MTLELLSAQIGTLIHSRTRKRQESEQLRPASYIRQESRVRKDREKTQIAYRAERFMPPRKGTAALEIVWRL
jgi:hypothetical protein